ncbi:hypothetical protein MBBAR_30c00180 [Methanobrevibacter arboriphilus JCM 13429 = DSM 1125]|uniref:Putative nickel insertion protein n=1 Tax=Methanobrevibacter arboriphilus JCM 13429 = DSM 1125 TaxID=1300164 RepID=A0A1V6N007_METAZ|nr:nickel pincer cofactor biosynthesis protein LarC [Methanobrevibacter arboriphilus]OQD58018.1 hypothetical protein MBBAR_30c00180 [Methanobrevibacter arboriphilus JCM 13429 = DSM 1125]
MVLIIDPQNAGIAGNMIGGAFIDLGCNHEEMKLVMEYVANDFGGVNVKINNVNKAGIESIFLEVETIDKDNHNNHSISYKELLSKINQIEEIEFQKKNSIFGKELIKDIFNISRKVFKRIAVSEAKIHGKSLEDVNFHEVGAADAVADIFGSVFGFCKLGFHNKKEKVIGLPVAVGGGSVKSVHGMIPVPAPVTLEIISERNISSFGGPVNAEIATPTGVALYAELCDEFMDFQPFIKVDKIAYGAGKKDFDFPNVLRIIKAKSNIKSQGIDVIETNVDHLSGESIGYLFDKLMKEGARDVLVIPVIMKKNRPGDIIKVISRKEDTDRLVSIIFKETGTLGIRVSQNFHRGIANREFISLDIDIEGEIESIKFKIGYIDGEIISSRPEYEDIRKIATKRNIPLNKVLNLANFEINQYLSNLR